MRLNFFRSRSDLSVNKVSEADSYSIDVHTSSRQRRQRSSTEPCHVRKSRPNTLDHVMDLFQEHPHQSLQTHKPKETSEQEFHLPDTPISRRASSVQIFPRSGPNTHFLSKSKRSVASWISRTQSDNTQSNYHKHHYKDQTTPDTIYSDSSDSNLLSRPGEPPAEWTCHSSDWKTSQQSEPNIRCISVTHSPHAPSISPVQKERTKLTPAQKQRRKTTVFETTLLVAPDFIEEEPDNIEDDWTCCEPLSDTTDITAMLEIMERETQRLRQCVNNERDQYFICLQDKNDTMDCLRMAQQEIKCLKRKISIGKIVGFTDISNEALEFARDHMHHKRRHSITMPLIYPQPTDIIQANIGSIYFKEPLNPYTNHMPVERKIHILLEEINAMQTDEINMEKKYQYLTTKKQQLEYQLRQQDDTINQLRQELEIAKLAIS
ncbi:hypothetical protein CLU79DRAFT_780218 [Phycomyces nitens]|nr:hypothetical protein CLU79DRAFT_780218 [Phycomyces nitens]